MELRLETKADHYVLHISGEIDLYAAPELKEAFTDYADLELKNCIVDLDKVYYIDSTGLGVLMFGASLTRKNGGQFSCVNVSAEIKQLMAAVNLEQALGLGADWVKLPEN